MNITKFFLISSVCLIALHGHANAEDAAASGFNAAQKAEIEGIVKDYLKAHPEVIIEGLQSFQQKQEETARASAEENIEKNKEALFSKNLPFAGNPDGDVTVVEFFDYNCGYCKQAHKDLDALLAEDKNVRIVFKELPVLGPSSEIAARWSHAAFKQGKFYEFHSALMSGSGGINEESLSKIAKDLGLDVEKLKTDAESEETKTVVRDSRDLAMQLQIQGTPGFVVGNKLYRGYIGADGMKNAIAEARGKKSE